MLAMGCRVGRLLMRPVCAPRGRHAPKSSNLPPGRRPIASYRCRRAPEASRSPIPGCTRGRHLGDARRSVKWVHHGLVAKRDDRPVEHLRFPVSPAEERVLRALEGELHRAGWARFVTTERQLKGWTELASEVNAYSGSVDDYTNDLCGRDALELIVQGSPQALATRLGDLLREIDDGFLLRTVPDDAHVLGRYYRSTPAQGWWWRRVPSAGPLAEFLGVNTPDGGDGQVRVT